MTIRNHLLGATAAIAFLLPLAAQAGEGFYLGGNVGLSMPTDSTFTDATNSNDVEYDIGFAGLLTAGYQFENNWRAEAEFGARMNQIGDITGTGASAPAGRTNVYSLLANAIYGIPTGTKFTPYIGAGAGIAWVRNSNVATTLATSIDDSDTAFAYQGIAGMEYDINPYLKASLDYHYFRTADTSFTSAAATQIKGDYENHTVTVGLRYIFPKAQPLPAPVPAPVVDAAPAQPQVPNNYIVFFDFDRSAVSPEADRIVAAAAANAQQARATVIEVTGHADRSGSANYNLRLSQRRADSIKQALVAKGIPANEISVTAAGESQPLVATADGVREAQNRRVQVILK